MKIKSSSELDRSIINYRAYLSDVIDEMVEIPLYLKKELMNAVREMIDIYIKTGLPPKSISLDKNKKLDIDISAIIALLNDKIKIYLQNKLANKIYPISDEATEQKTLKQDRLDSMWGFMDEEIDGKTVSDRIINYTNNFKYEAEAFIVSGLAFDKSSNDIVNDYSKNASKPYDSQMIKEAMASNEFEARNIKSKGVSYGNGISTSSLVALTLVGQDTAFRFYNKTLRDSWLLDDSISGWISIRNSSYPCQLCDSQAYVFHPMSELFMAWHRRCVCLCVPITKNML